MHQNAIMVIAATLGIMAGAGGTYIATPEPKVEAQAISKAELVAAISADPSLCPIPTVEAPTEAEALAAYRKAHAASPLVWDRNNLPEISLALGQCRCRSRRRLHDLRQAGTRSAAYRSDRRLR